MTRFFLASGNAHKAAELQSLAQASSVAIEIRSARELGGMPHVDEDTGTFVGNARKKAFALRPLLPVSAWALADDSGVRVDALHGGPGVESAYFAGPQADATANLNKLVEVMKEVAADRRGAQFCCVLVALSPAGEEYIFSGECRGNLLVQPRGGAGFGYDPLFIPQGYDQSYAELGDEVKCRISHRSQAWSRLAEWWRRVGV